MWNTPQAVHVLQLAWLCLIWWQPFLKAIHHRVWHHVPLATWHVTVTGWILWYYWLWQLARRSQCRNPIFYITYESAVLEHHCVIFPIQNQLGHHVCGRSGKKNVQIKVAGCSCWWPRFSGQKLTPEVRSGHLLPVTRWPVRYTLTNKLVSNLPHSANDEWLKSKSLVVFIGYTQLKAKTCKCTQNSLR